MVEKPKGTKRREQAAKSRNDIYEAAIALFSERGFETTTVRDITSRAGVSVGNFYHYYPSKQAVLEDNFHRADEFFEGIPGNGALKEEGAARIGEYMERYARLILATGFDLSKQLYTYKTKLFLREGGAMQSSLTALIRECQVAGAFPESLDASEVCRQLFIIGRGVAFDWCLHEGRTDLIAEMRKLADLAVSGYCSAGSFPSGQLSFPQQ